MRFGSNRAAFVRERRDIQGLRNPEILIFITSPDRITPLHFDAEVNFLVQIASSKNLWVCDANDRTITTEAELEVYHAGDISADHYRPRVNTEAQHFSRNPGDAVHLDWNKH